MASEYTTIKVRTGARDKLANKGRYKESMADIVDRVIGELEQLES